MSEAPEHTHDQEHDSVVDAYVRGIILASTVEELDAACDIIPDDLQACVNGTVIGLLHHVAVEVAALAGCTLEEVADRWVGDESEA